MRKLVVLLVVLLAFFTFLRDFPSATANGSKPVKAEIQSSLIP